MASIISGLGRAMHNGMVNGMNLSNQITDYQNANLVDQYKYPAYMAEANAARTGAEAQTMFNLGAAVDMRGLMDQPAEGVRADGQLSAGASDTQALLNTGQAPSATTLEAILGQNVYGYGAGNEQQDLLQRYAQLYQQNNNAGDALQGAFQTVLPGYLR